MYLDPSFAAKFHKPGAIHHARFMGKGLYYLKLALLMSEIRPILNFSKNRVQEILRMAQFIAIFYAPKFLTAEKPDIAPIQVKTCNTMLQVHTGPKRNFFY